MLIAHVSLSSEVIRNRTLAKWSNKKTNKCKKNNSTDMLLKDNNERKI